MTTTNGKIATARPAVTSEISFYVLPASTEVFATLTICNRYFQAITYSVSHTDSSGGSAAGDWLRYLRAISAYSEHRIPIVMGNEETLRIQVSVANSAAFSLTGRIVT